LHLGKYIHALFYVIFIYNVHFIIVEKLPETRSLTNSRTAFN